MFAGTLTLSNACTSAETLLGRGLHRHDPPCTKIADYVLVGASEAQEQCETLLCLYDFNTSTEVPQTLGEFYTGGFYA